MESREGTVKSVAQFIKNVASKIASLAYRNKIGLSKDPETMAKEAIAKLQQHAKTDGKGKKEPFEREALNFLLKTQEGIKDNLERKFREEYYSLMKSFADYLDKKDDVETWMDSTDIIQPFLDIKLSRQEAVDLKKRVPISWTDIMTYVTIYGLDDLKSDHPRAYDRYVKEMERRVRMKSHGASAQAAEDESIENINGMVEELIKVLE